MLYRHSKTAGYLYQAVLRAELSERLRVRWRPVERGTADVVGVPRGVIEHFSRRRAEILEHMAERGERSARAAQVATLETRRRKDYRVPVDRLRAEWRARAAEHGLDRRDVRRVFGRAAHRALDGDWFERSARALEGSDGLTRERSTFTRRDVVQAFAEAGPHGAHVCVVEAHSAAFLARQDVIELEAERGEPRYTTRGLLRIERELLDGARARRERSAGLAGEHAVEAALGARPTLSDEQRGLVDTLTRSGDGVQVVRAAAGTGKTFALDGAREAWQRSGVAVLGCALSARAACELRDQAGIDATTIARLRHGLDHGVALSPATVLIVDEAGMVGTRDLAALAEAACRADAKLVLVGDDRQLPEIAAGGAFRALAELLGAIELHDVRRQREGWDREALAALRTGDVGRFARDYDQHGRIVAAPSAEAARAALVEDWWAAHERGDRALMIAHRRSDVADLNAGARQRLRAAGRIGPDELPTDERAFAVGDRVVATRNDRDLAVVNGQAGLVTAIGPRRLGVHFDDGHRVELSDQSVRDVRLDHGYAITAHRAQGITVDRAFVLGSDELYREWGYTALSRHRDEARFYVSATPTFLNAAPAPLQADANVTRQIARMLEDSRAQHLALNGVRRDDLGSAIANELERAHERLAEVDTRLDALHDEHAQTRWYQRSRRSDIERIMAGSQRGREHWQVEVARLTDQLEQRPARHEPTLWRGGDPLVASERARRLEREVSHQRDRAHDLDLGLEL